MIDRSSIPKVLKSEFFYYYSFFRWIYYLLYLMAYLTKAVFRNSFENRGKDTEKIVLEAKRLQSMKKQQESV